MTHGRQETAGTRETGFAASRQPRRDTRFAVEADVTSDAPVAVERQAGDEAAVAPAWQSFDDALEKAMRAALSDGEDVVIEACLPLAVNAARSSSRPWNTTRSSLSMPVWRYGGALPTSALVWSAAWSKAPASSASVARQHRGGVPRADHCRSAPARLRDWS